MDLTNPESSQVIYDVPIFFKVYKNGLIERYRKHDFAPPSNNSVTGVRSKDIVIVPENNVTVRLYLPKITQNDQKFPLLVYFHGGGFVIESAFSTYYDSYLHSVAAETNVIAVSIEYRLAPEHKIPACYDDSWAVMKWVSQGSEPWLKSYADFSRVFLSVIPLHSHASSVTVFNGMNFSEWHEQMIVGNNINNTIPQTENAKEYLKFVEEYFCSADYSRWYTSG
ncbi:probable carboxylesterase 1 [Solanum tuberosum]|uniref:probable carboxylesterase 1 n=1 Tax=Solanum tuberosum TaxID=4113 RepID=UPI00073A41ED|nr:PREDICTED: probable carboxylesterase 1 [Solanum tuberosum]